MLDRLRQTTDTVHSAWMEARSLIASELPIIIHAVEECIGTPGSVLFMAMYSSAVSKPMDRKPGERSDLDFAAVVSDCINMDRLNNIGTWRRDNHCKYPLVRGTTRFINEVNPNRPLELFFWPVSTFMQFFPETGMAERIRTAAISQMVYSDRTDPITQLTPIEIALLIAGTGQVIYRGDAATCTRLIEQVNRSLDTSGYAQEGYKYFGLDGDADNLLHQAMTTIAADTVGQEFVIFP